MKFVDPQLFRLVKTVIERRKYPTDPFKILKPRDQGISELCLDLERRSTYGSSKVVKGRSGEYVTDSSFLYFQSLLLIIIEKKGIHYPVRVIMRAYFFVFENISKGQRLIDKYSHFLYVFNRFNRSILFLCNTNCNLRWLPTVLSSNFVFISDDANLRVSGDPVQLQRKHIRYYQSYVMFKSGSKRLFIPFAIVC